MADYITADTPSISFVSVLTKTNPPAGELITADTPSISFVSVLIRTNPSAGDQITANSPSIGLVVVLVRYNPPAGDQITADSPSIELTWQSGVKVVVELVKLNADGTEDILNSINDIIIGKIEGRWVQLVADVKEDNNNVIIEFKLLNQLGKEIKTWSFTTAEFKGIGGAVGLFSEIKTFIDYVTMKYSRF